MKKLDIKPTLIDNLVGMVSPQAKLKRLHHRAKIDAALGGYKGGRRDRRMTRNFRPQETSINADLSADLPDLRSRSRDLARNTPVATGAVQRTLTSVLGDGLTVTPKVDRDALDLDDEAAEAWDKAAAREWALWCQQCDLTGVQSFAELQWLVFRAVLESGDVFVLRRWKRRAGDTYATKIQVVEGDRVSNPTRRADSEGLTAGVQTSADGYVSGYHIASRHPDDFGYGAAKMDWTYVPARDGQGRPLVLHVFDRQRPDQARGIPFLAPVIEAIKVIGDYAEAEATAAVVSAMFTVFLTSDGDTNPIGDPVTPEDATKPETELGHGAVVELLPGEKPEFANPSRPNAQFDTFFVAVVKQIGAALEIPFEVLLASFNSSYSASRAALETAWQMFRRRRTWFAAKFCQPVYELAIAEAVARGRLEAPGFFTDPLRRAAWLRASWRGPARPSLDQSKDANADRAYLDMGVTSRRRIARERFGEALEDVAAEREQEARLLGAPASASPTPSNEAEQDEDDPPAGDEDKSGDDDREEDENA